MLNSFRLRLKKLPPSARRYLLIAFFAMLLIALPVMVWGLVTGNFELRKRAASGEIPPNNEISLNDPSISLYARDHYILANGIKYVINKNTLSFGGSSAGNTSSVSLRWEESGQIINLRIYFEQKSDSWTISEIKTSVQPISGNMGVEESFYGPFPSVQIGQAYTDNIDYSGRMPFGLNGLLHIEGLYVKPEFPPTPGVSPGTPGKPSCVLISINQSSGIAPLTVTLNGAGGAGATLGIDGYQWDFENDGIWDTTDITLDPVAHTYNEPGIYNPKYRVHSINGNWSDICGYRNSLEVLSSTSLLQFKVKFAGVTSRPVDDSVKQIKTYGTSDNGGSVIGSTNGKAGVKSVNLTVDDSGVYHGSIELSGGSYYGYHYRLRIKGPKHLQEVFNNVVFERGVETDLTSKALRPGDLNQDSVLDKTDLTEVSKRIFSNKTDDISFGDVNFDGRVDIIDRTLILNTLSIQYDQE